jgi:GDSL-like Lipase/Acylhydrolase family
MKFIIATLATIALINGAAAAEPAQACEVPQSLISNDSGLTRVMNEIRDHHRLDISVVGTGSSSLPGPDGARFAYPARLQDVLRQWLPGNDIKVIAHVQSRRTAAEMTAGLKKVLADDKPVLVIWQAGTFDAVSGIEPDEFRTSLEEGVDMISAAGADIDLMNMQYSPHTVSILGVSAYADAMRWVAQQRGALLFDRLAIMRYWNDEGTFDLYAATKNYDMARRVHDCIGRALASQIINAAHLDAMKMQTTR